MSHTPGPWTALWPKFDALIVDADERVIASVSFNDHADKECEANTHLIAVAPDMLEALHVAHSFLCHLSSDVLMLAGIQAFDVVGAAITRAEGAK